MFVLEFVGVADYLMAANSFPPSIHAPLQRDFSVPLERKNYFLSTLSSPTKRKLFFHTVVHSHQYFTSDTKCVGFRFFFPPKLSNSPILCG